MAVTRAQMANRILRRLGVLGTGQKAKSEDTSYALQAYDELYSQLEELGLAEWGATDDVPNEYVNDIVNWAAYNLIDDFKCSTQRYQRIQIASSRAEPNIRRIQSGEFVYSPVEIQNH